MHTVKSHAVEGFVLSFALLDSASRSAARSRSS
jgi:hypothetical protein